MSDDLADKWQERFHKIELNTIIIGNIGDLTIEAEFQSEIEKEW